MGGNGLSSPPNEKPSGETGRLIEMAGRPRDILICSCDKTMPLDTAAIARGCRRSDIVEASRLCRDELGTFRASAENGEVLVACTQETSLFEEAASEAGSNALTFVNIRETAGWSDEASASGPKMAALIAAAVEVPPPIPFISLESGGVILIYGRDEQAVEAGKLLQDQLDVTVMLAPGSEMPFRSVTEFPVVAGKVVGAKGHLGAFELRIDQYAMPQPWSRDQVGLTPPRNGAVSRCDVVLDISGLVPLFPAADLRDGYLRADPGNQGAVLRAVFKARDLSGTFDKPRYINFNESLCAHSRSKIVGCHRCLDVCPAGAITPADNYVSIDGAMCAGCGQCSAVCPTGAAAYALPPADWLMRKVRTLLLAFAEAGGSAPVLLFHDREHGSALIEALARHGNGLPASVLPIEINEVTQVGLDTIAAGFAFGASALRFLLRARPRQDPTALRTTLALADPILSGLGLVGERVATIETDEPFALGETLRAMAPMPSVMKPATFAPLGGKREVMRLALRELHTRAPAPTDVIPLPSGAPFGAIEIKVEGCTLCLSCVSACPTGALSDDPECPTVRFAEDACVQCGLCQATCPEKVISLVPQIDFRAATASSRVLKREEPFLCIRCGEAFGVKSSVERVIAKLENQHWMFVDSKKRLDLIKMCADCRVEAMADEQFDPYGAPQRPKVRTTDDYLRERDVGDPKES
jgi:ferredoxin